MSIVAQKITYIHPDNQVLFKGIDLTINKGQKVALVGNNGSGKSTFLRILAGTLQAQEGEIIYPTPITYPSISGNMITRRWLRPYVSTGN